MPNSKQISLLSASRGRPDACAAMAESALSTAADPEAVEILVYLDADDPTRDDYAASLSERYQPYVTFHQGTPLRPIAGCNVLGTMATGRLMSTCPDDLRFETAGWDSKLLHAADQHADGIVCVFPDDGGRAGDQICTQPFVTRKVRDLLGYVLFPGCQHFGADLWAHELFNQLGRLMYVGDARVIHAHWDQGNGGPDATAERQNPLQAFDDAMFISCARWLPVELELLRQHMRPSAQELASKMR